MIRFKTLSLRHKLTVVIMSVVTVALLLALAAVFLIELREHRISLTSELGSMADLAGATVRAAVQFEDEQTASRFVNPRRGEWVAATKLHEFDWLPPQIYLAKSCSYQTHPRTAYGYCPLKE